MPRDSDQYDFFVSYARADNAEGWITAFVAEAHRRLTAAGFKTWFDERQLDPGDEWHKKIKHGCEASRVVFPQFSHAV